MAHTRAQLREAIRQLSNTQNNTGFITDAELNDRIDEAKSDLYDLIIGVYELHYASVTDQFTLAGGVGGNTFALPATWYKTLGLDVWASARWADVRGMGSFADRNSDAFRRYLETGLTVYVNPPEFAAGVYRFWFTPVITLIRTIAHNAADAVVGATKTWSFVNGAFAASDVGGDLIVGSTSNAANTGIFPIVSVTNATTVVTTGSPTNETFGATVTAEVRPSLDTIMDVWYELIEVLGAWKVLDKREMNPGSLVARAQVLTARVQSMARNRRGEPRQAPMADGRFRSRFPGIADDR